MVKDCVGMVLKCLNQLPNENSACANMSPISIVLGICKPDYEEIKKPKLWRSCASTSTTQYSKRQ